MYQHRHLWLFLLIVRQGEGATTLSMMTFIKITFSLVTLSITTFEMNVVNTGVLNLWAPRDYGDVSPTKLVGC
jgi:hypothetical protein